jgi:long-chain acyl-CoA synthetase
MLISDIVRRNADFYPDFDAVVVPGGKTVSWGELDERTDRLGRAFLELGLQKGDRVATFMPNGAEYIDFFFACAKSGVIGATTNIRLGSGEVSSYHRYIEPTAVIVHADLREQAGWIDEVPSVKHVIGVGDDHDLDLDFEQLIASQPAGDPGSSVDATDVYQLGATSGTTGLPKGAILTHHNAVAALTNWVAELDIRIGDTNIQNIPLFFNPGGPAGLHPVMLKGGRTVIPAAFEPGNFLRLVPEYKVTHTILVPTMVGMVLAHPDCESYDLSSIRGVMSGGSPLPREVLRRAREVFGNVFFPLYGMAETYSCGLILRREEQFVDGTPAQVARLASAGRPMVLMQARVVGEDGNDVPHDGETAGEIWMRGDNVSPGYFRMPEETAGSRNGDWLMSGDIATVDEEGFVTIVDRAKDIIITGGINVFSRDIEQKLEAHPAVYQVAVIGVPDKKWGEAIHAVVVLKEGAEVSAEELIAFASEGLASYKKPRSVEIVDELPISATGKILKRELRNRHWQDQERRV